MTYVCVVECFAGDRLYQVGEEWKGEGQPPKHFKPVGQAKKKAEGPKAPDAYADPMPLGEAQKLIQGDTALQKDGQDPKSLGEAHDMFA